MNKLLEMWNDESGQDLAEYAMMIGLVALAVVTAVAVLGTNVAGTFNDIGTTLETST
jgi:pilus assembly protein Flp/PilA